MGRERCVDGLMNAVNVFILLMIVLLYVVTGTGLGDDAVAALSSGTIYRGGGEGLVAGTVDQTISNYGVLAHDGMCETDRTILRLMTDEPADGAAAEAE